jgi:hypothetical protein
MIVRLVEPLGVVEKPGQLPGFECSLDSWVMWVYPYLGENRRNDRDIFFSCFIFHESVPLIMLRFCKIYINPFSFIVG